MDASRTEQHTVKKLLVAEGKGHANIYNLMMDFYGQQDLEQTAVKN